MADDAHLQPLVAAELAALADDLEGLPDARWETASLCEGWRVREVVAHMTMAARYTEDTFLAELADCGFDFTTLSNRVASRDADLPTADLVANLRSERMRHWTPPHGGHRGALSHAVIHRLDVTVPLALPGPAPEALRVVLDDLADLADGVGSNHFGVPVGDRRFRATDMDWSQGSGPEHTGTAADLVLVLSGRRVPV